MMKHKSPFAIVFVLLISIVAGISAFGQGVVVERSTERIMIKGKIYFIHQVKKSETLYSIAKAYSISLDSIYTYNPGTTEGIKIDQLLRIPDYKSKGTVFESKHEVEIPENIKEPANVQHTIVAGQTLFGIARIYGLKPSDIERANPGMVKDSLKPGQQIVIPMAQTKKDSANKNYIIHKVQEKETLFSISRLYKTSVDSIKIINGLSNDSILRLGMELRIPMAVGTALLKDTAQTTVTTSTPIVISMDCDSFLAKTQQNQVNLTLLLPLFASKADGGSEDENVAEEKRHNRQKSMFSPQSASYVEFYQGCLLALEDLKRKKIDVALQVYDTENDSLLLLSIMKKPEFQSSNVVIGPVSPSLMSYASRHMQKNGTYWVSPFADISNITKENSFVFQVNAGKENLFLENIKHIPDNDTDKVIVVYNGSEASGINEDFRSAAARSKELKVTSMWKELNVYHNGFSELVSMLDSTKENIIISPSVDEIFVSNLLSILESKLLLYRIKVIGRTEWTLFSSIDMNYLFDQQLCYNTPFYIDYESEPVKRFLKKYRLYFGTEPGQMSKQGFNYAMLGYDVTHYFTMGYSQYGGKLPLATLCFNPEMLITQFRFQKASPVGGMINTTLHKVSYTRDYNVLHE